MATLAAKNIAFATLIVVACATRRKFLLLRHFYETPRRQFDLLNRSCGESYYPPVTMSNNNNIIIIMKMMMMMMMNLNNVLHTRIIIIMN